MKRIVLSITTMLLTLAAFAQNQLLPNLVYSQEPAVVKGQIIGIPASMESINIVMTPSWTSDEIGQTVALDSNGKFETKFDACVTSMAMIRLGDRNVKRFYITPGQEVKVTVDMSNNNVTCEGPLAALNNSMANYYDEFREQNLNAEINGQGISKLRGFTVAQYRDKLMELYNKGVKKLNDDDRLSPEFREYMMPHYQFLTIALLTGYERLLKYANGGQGEYKKTADYYDPVKGWNFTNQNGFLYQSGGSVEGTSGQVGRETGAMLTYPASARQVIAARKYMTGLETLKPLSDDQLRGIKAQCPAFEKMLLAQNEATKARIAENEKNNLFNIKSIPESLTGEDVFKAIVKDYKGKKVLVDFWATWCGPCRQAMQTILPVKEELWGKVAFVYVTGETSPKALWNKMAPDIHGDHYYVTAAQWETLLKQFGVQGIPAYVVVGADNEVVTKHIGYPGNEVILNELK